LDCAPFFLLAAMAAVPEALRQKWWAAFQAFDVDQSGTIDAKELSAVMASMKMVPQSGEVGAMIAAVDLDGDGVVSFQEFEQMMAASGRDRHTLTGFPSEPARRFSHVVQRHVRMRDVAKLITNQCTDFVDQFCRQHWENYADLPLFPGGEKTVENTPAWHDVYRKFAEEAELTVQSSLVLWGVASQQSFDSDFLEAVMQCNLLDDFLKLTEYEAFLNRMRGYVQQATQGTPVTDEQVPALLPNLERPSTPHGHQQTQRRLTELDSELAQLDMQRNRLLAERRRLIGCEVTPVTTAALKHDLEALRWKEDVGFD